jgi:hypothetical protein
MGLALIAVPGVPTAPVLHQAIILGSFALAFSSQPLPDYAASSAAVPDTAPTPDTIAALDFATDSSGFSVLLGSAAPASTRPTTRLQNNIKKSKVYTDDTVRCAYLMTSGEPKNIEEALSHSKW